MAYNDLIVNFSFHKIRSDKLLEGKPYSSLIAIPYGENITVPTTPSYSDWRIIPCPEIPPSSANYKLILNAKDITNGNYFTMGRISNRYKLYYYDNTLTAWLFTGNVIPNDWEWYFSVNFTTDPEQIFTFENITMLDGDTLPVQFDFVNTKYSLVIENVDIDRNIIIKTITNTGFTLESSPAGGSLPATVMLKIAKI